MSRRVSEVLRALSPCPDPKGEGGDALDTRATPGIGLSRRVPEVLRALFPCLDPKGEGGGFASRGDPG